MGNLDDMMVAADDPEEGVEDGGQAQADPIPIHLLMDVGMDLCGVSPEELTPATLEDNFQ